jgi:hypothetical protein
MSVTRLRVLVAASLAVAGCTLTGIIAAAPASAGSTQVVLINYCNDHSAVKPATFDLPGCMPSSEYLTGLKWVSWRSVAYGSGEFAINNCTPTCAGGKYIKHPILTVLWGAKPWPKHAGKYYFSRLTVIFTGKPPRGPSAQTTVLPATVP